MIKRGLTILQRFAAALSLLVGLGCSEGGSAPSSGSASAGGAGVNTATGTHSASAACAADGLRAEVAQVRDYLCDWYYWYKEITPLADLRQLQTAEEALEALRVRPKDRYSFITEKQAIDEFFHDNTTIGFGITTRETAAKALMVAAVLPDSPAQAVDVRRGDRILAIDGVDVASLSSTDRANAFGPIQVGVTRSFRFFRAGQSFERTLSKSQFRFVGADLTSVLPNGARKAGYVYLIAFTDTTSAQFQAALDRLVAQGAQDLVIDLRNNSGGRIEAALAVANFLLTDAQNGQLIWRLNHNDRHAPIEYRVGAAPRYGFEQLVVLTSEGTCSAPELLLTALRAYRRVTAIGTTSCGKPYGFVPQDIGANKQLYAVSSVGGNADQPIADYSDGIAPDCVVADDFSAELGAADEKLLGQALAHLAGAGCRPSALSAPAVKQLPPTEATPSPGKRYRGLTDFLDAY